MARLRDQYHQTLRPLFDMLGVCRLPWIELGLNERHYENFYTHVTGSFSVFMADMPSEELLSLDGVESLLCVVALLMTQTRSAWLGTPTDTGVVCTNSPSA